MAKKPAVGDDAPDFELEGTDGTFRLSEHRGEKVLLLFYPGDETTVCTKQFCSYRDNSEAFGALGVTAVGISGKDVDSKKSFQDNHKLNVPLLADPDGTVAAAVRRLRQAAEDEQARGDHRRRGREGGPPPRPRARPGLPDGRRPEGDAGFPALAGVGSVARERDHNTYPHLSLLRGHLWPDRRDGGARGREGARRRAGRVQQGLPVPEGHRAAAPERRPRPAAHAAGARRRRRAGRGHVGRGVPGDRRAPLPHPGRARPQRGGRVRGQPQRAQPVGADLRPGAA